MEYNDFLKAIRGVSINRISPLGVLKQLPADAIMLGVGASELKLPPTALLLDNKMEQRRSCADLVANIKDDYFSRWPLWSQRPMKPQDVLDHVTLVVDDASPDSVWTLIVLLARMACCDMRATHEVWLPSINRWEEEGMVDVPELEWPSLASALAHSYLRFEKDDVEEDYRDAWHSMLTFAAESLTRGRTPKSITDDGEPWPMLRQAEAALEQERQTYLEWLPHAIITQLSLPVRGGNDRRLLVDALIFNEDLPTGTAKVFYRLDKTMSPLGRGFTFAASYRANAEPGEDVTITLDPRWGLHLQELWKELEMRENNAWENENLERPAWDPRFPEQSPHNQPWYINKQRTLIASPRMVPHSAKKDALLVPGSRLKWRDIQDAIWKVYNPLRDVQVVAIPSGITTPILDLRSQSTGEKSSKTVLAARWPAGEMAYSGPAPRSLGTAPVIERLLAALTSRRETGGVQLHNLPQLGGWQRIDLSGGFAVVTSIGVFILDDWRDAVRLNIMQLLESSLRAAAFDQDLTNIEQKQIVPLALEIEALLQKGKAPSEQPNLVVRAAQASIHLAKLRSRNARIPSDPDERLLREGLDKLWALESRLAVMEQQVNAIGTSLKALGDAQVRRIGQLVAFYGFPFYLADDLASPAAKAVQSIAQSVGWHPTWLSSPGKDPSSGLWWLCFLGIFGLSVSLAAWIRGRDSVSKHPEVSKDA